MTFPGRGVLVLVVTLVVSTDGHDLFHLLAGIISPLARRASLWERPALEGLFQEVPLSLKIKFLTNQSLTHAEVHAIPLGLVYLLPEASLPNATDPQATPIVQDLVQFKLHGEAFNTSGPNPMQEFARWFSMTLQWAHRTRDQRPSFKCQRIPYLQPTGRVNTQSCAIRAKHSRHAMCRLLGALVHPDRPTSLWSMRSLDTAGDLLFCLPASVLADLPALKMIAKDVGNGLWSRAQNRSLYYNHRGLEVDHPSKMPAAIILRGAMSPRHAHSIQSMHEFMQTLPFLSAFACFLHCQTELAFLTNPERMLPFLDQMASFQLEPYLPIILVHLQSSAHDIRFSPRTYSQLLQQWIRMEQDDWLEILWKSRSVSFRRIILGLQCSLVEAVPITQILPLVHLHNLEKVGNELEPLRSLQCQASKILAYLADKRGLSNADQSGPLLDQLTPPEIQALQGELLISLGVEQIVSMKTPATRLKIVTAISRLPLFHLIALAQPDELERLALGLWRDLALMPNDGESLIMGNLLYFLNVEQVGAIRSLIPRIQGPICTSQAQFEQWSALVQTLNLNEEALLTLGDSIVLLPTEILGRWHPSTLYNVAPYILEHNEYFQSFGGYFQSTLLDRCSRWLDQAGLDSSFLRLKIESTYSFLKQRLSAEQGSSLDRFKRQTIDIDKVRRGFKAARQYWRYLFENNLLTSVQKTQAREIFQGFIHDIVAEQRVLLKVEDSLPDDQVEKRLHELTAQGLLDPGVEQQLHDFSDELMVQVVHKLENVLNINLGRPEHLPDGTLRDELVYIFGDSAPKTSTTSSTTTTTTELSLSLNIEYNDDLFEKLDNLFIEHDSLGGISATLTPRTEPSPSIGPFSEFNSGAEALALVSRYKYTPPMIHWSEAPTDLKAWPTAKLLIHLACFGELDNLSDDQALEIWTRVVADLLPGAYLSAETILQLGPIIRAASDDQFVSVTAMVEEPFGLEALASIAAHLRPSLVPSFASQLEPLLQCSGGEAVQNQIALIMASLRPIWCDLNPHILGDLWESCPQVFSNILGLLDAMPVCSQLDTLELFKAIVTTLYSDKLVRLSAPDLASLGPVVGAWLPSDLAAIPPKAMEGLTHSGYSQIGFERLHSMNLSYVPLEFGVTP